MPIVDQDRVELAYLRYFYQNIGSYLGPSDDEIYDMIKKSYVELGNELPETYKSEEE